jgi:acyl-CoA reductase-like NAD-dependent aldehyde dehydrogenase
VGRIPVCGQSEVDAAVAAAVKAAPGWARTSPADRAAALKAGARRLRDRIDEIAELQSREGASRWVTAGAASRPGSALSSSTPSWAPLHRGRSLQGGWGASDLMLWEPRGVCVVLTPWNDPVAIVLQGVAAALAVGDPVVLKPSERTPLCGALVAGGASPRSCRRACSRSCTATARPGPRSSPAPRSTSSTTWGSSVTGRAIAEACARTGAHAVLEGGGKDACIVDAGVDPVWAAGRSRSGAFANTGQICVAVERVYVHADVAEPVPGRTGRGGAGQAARPRPAGRPPPARGRRGAGGRRGRGRRPGADRRHDARRARCLVPARPCCPAAPTTWPSCARRPSAGRLPVQVVGSYDEALAAAARSSYGLAATVLTPDLEHAQRAVRELPVGHRQGEQRLRRRARRCRAPAPRAAARDSASGQSCSTSSRS